MYFTEFAVNVIVLLSLIHVPKKSVGNVYVIDCCFFHVLPSANLVYIPGPPSFAKYLLRKSPGNTLVPEPGVKPSKP